jgi:hypothetical protein
MKFGIIGMIAISLIGLITFGSIAMIGTAGVNTNDDYSSYYKYEVSLVDRYEFDTDGKSLDPESPDYDPMEQEAYIEVVDLYDQELVEIIETTANVSVMDYEITKNEENITTSYFLPSGN